MNVFLFLSLCIICAFSDENATVTVCREDKYDRCECDLKVDGEKIPYLDISCVNWDELNTTKIALPRRVFQTYDIEYIEINLSETSITQIPSSAISDQLSIKLRSLTLTCDDICQISPGAFDGLPILESLSISGGTNNSFLNTNWLTADLGQSLLSLLLSLNSISQIQPNTFNQLGRLKLLDLALNSIQNLSDEAFFGLTSLDTLQISTNQLTKIPVNAMKSLKNLTGFFMSYNKLDKINKDGFKDLGNLVKLDISDNQLTKIPTLALNSLKKLSYLDVGGNDFRNIEANSFSQLINLETLILDRAHIENIPSGLFKNLQNLVELNLNYNNLKIGSDTFMNLKRLKKLQLSECGLINVPSFSNIPNLEELNIDYGNISELESDSFQGLDKLISLNMYSNPLKKIHDKAFKGLTRLRNINLGFTALTEVPFKALSELKSLKKLTLAQSKIKRISKDSFSKLSQITWLNLSGNQIKTIESHSFSSLGNVTYLELMNNQIKCIENNAFDGLIELRYLYLNGNLGIEFAENAFGMNILENLERLDLANCQIRSLPNTLFQSLPNLWYLSLIVNNFSSIPTTVRNIRQIYSLALNDNSIARLEPNIFNNSKIHDLILFDMTNLTTIDNCAFCGLTVWSISLGGKKLETIHDNAFGFANNSTTKTKKIRKISITSSSIMTLGRDLLPWTKLDSIDITNNPANCNPAMDWLFRNPDLKWAYGREDRCSDIRCKQYPFYEPCQITTTTALITKEETTTFRSSDKRISISLSSILFVCLLQVLRIFEV